MALEPAGRLAIDVDIERVLIGSMLMMATDAPPPPALPPSRFGQRAHQIIWGTILDLHRRGAPYNLPAVASALRERGRLEDAGGAGYLGSLEALRLTEETLEYYVSRIKAKAAQRAFGTLGRAIQALALQPDEDEGSVASRYHALVRRADVACDIASRNGHKPTLVTKSLYQITTENLEPLAWVYEPWLAPGEVVILAGEPGLGKSWLALDLLFALTLARQFLGVTCTAKRRQTVLYLDEENNQRLVRHRVRRLVDGLDIGLSDLDPAEMGAHYATEQSVNLDDEASRALLAKKIEQLRPDWIIFDSLVRIHRRDENSNQEMSALIGGVIKPLAHSVGAGAVIIHHLGKSTKDRPEDRIAQRIRGASDIIGVADQVWGLEKVADSLQLTHIKCRTAQASDSVAVELEDVHAGNGVRFVYSQIAIATEQTLRQLISESGLTGIQRSTLITASESNTKAVTRALGKLHADGTVKKAREGKIVRYWLTINAPPEAS